MSFPTAFDTAIKPLPLNDLGQEARAAADLLAQRGYEVHIGLTPEYAEEISKMALEPSIKEYCPRDSAERFTDQAATEKWLSKGRAVFLLMKREGDNLTMAGYGWAGDGTSQHVPDGQTTFAIRIGEAGQGQGLATPYNRLIIAGSAVLYGAKSMWLETWQSNAGAVHVYHKLGFADVYQEPSERPTASGGKVADTRLYMTIDDDLANV